MAQSYYNSLDKIKAFFGNKYSEEIYQQIYESYQKGYLNDETIEYLKRQLEVTEKGFDEIEEQINEKEMG